VRSRLSRGLRVIAGAGIEEWVRLGSSGFGAEGSRNRNRFSFVRIAGGEGVRRWVRLARDFRAGAGGGALGGAGFGLAIDAVEAVGEAEGAVPMDGGLEAVGKLVAEEAAFDGGEAIYGMSGDGVGDEGGDAGRLGRGGPGGTAGVSPILSERFGRSRHRGRFSTGMGPRAGLREVSAWGVGSYFYWRAVIVKRLNSGRACVSGTPLGLEWLEFGRGLGALGAFGLSANWRPSG
jgi:hypothetical protein